MRHCFLMTLFMAFGCSDDAAPSDAGATRDADRADAPFDAASDGGSMPARHDVLFVGNSYVFTNDVSGRYRTIAEALAPPVRVEVVAPGGYTLAQHAADARTDGTPLARFLRTGTPEETAFDAIILQEQSQLGAFPETDPSRRTSVDAAVELAALARARDIGVVLYHTWGRRDGDPLNPALFPTFEAMQDRLDAGYFSLARRLATEGSRVRIAPVGAGFRAVFDDVVAGGGDPLATGSDFHALYEADGSHPSPRGAYLAACILAGTVLEADPASFPDDASLGSDTSSALRGPCARAVADPRWRVPIDTVSETTIEVAGLELAELGHSIAMSADGTRILAGAPNEDSAAGTARVFVREGARFVAEATLVPEGPRERANFGGSVAMSADGSRAIVGAYVDGGSRGSARVFSRSGSIWTEEGVLSDPSAAENEYFGYAVAMSGDGTRVLVGVPNERVEDESLGSFLVRVYARSGTTWAHETVLGGASTIPGERALNVVALSGDGMRALVGGPSSTVAPRIFVRAGSEWMEEATLPIDAMDAAALDDAGELALVSVPSSREVRAFRRTGTTWTEDAIVAAGDRGAFRQDVALALARDGSAAVVGRLTSATEFSDAVGSAETLVRAAPAWRAASTLASTGVDRFGASVVMSEDGSLAAVGAPGASAVHVFRLR